MVEHVFASNLQIILCKPMSTTNIIIISLFFIPFFVLKLKETSTSFCEVSRSHIRSSSTITECVGLQVYVNACYTKNSRSCKHDWTATEVDRFSCTLTT